jgi:hypothetical protein
MNKAEVRAKIPNIKELTPEQRALLAKQLNVEMGKVNNPALAVPQKPSETVAQASVEEVVKLAEGLPEGYVAPEILSLENPKALSLQEKLANMLNGGVSSDEAQAAMEALMNQSKN